MAEEVRHKKFAVIDGKSVFYRGYYAMPNLSTKDGTPTGGVYGFATMALEVIRRLKPDYVAVAWDKPKTNIRRRLELYPEYKAGRKPPPPDFYEQIPVLHELLQAFGWPLYELDDYEADDIMGTLARQADAKGIETLLITSDLDLLQVVDERVHVYALKHGLTNIDLYSPKSFEAKYGLKVDQFLDLKALKGDSSDNIPGVPGVGEKTAIQLLQDWKTLDGVYENLALTKESVRKKLESGKDLAYLSKKLGAIWTDAPIELNLSAVDGSKVQPEKLLDLLNKLEFRSLARQLPDIMQVAISNHQTANGAVPLQKGKNTIIDTDDKARELKLGDSEYFYIHSRSAGKHGRDPQVIIVSLNGRDTYTLDLRKLNKEAIAGEFRDVRPLVGYDVKSTLKALIELGVRDLPAVGHDVLIGAFLVNSLRREQSLTELAQADLHYEGTGFEDLDADELIARTPEIIAAIKALHDQQAKELASIPKLPELAANVEWPVIPVLARMEHQGIQLNVPYLEKFADELADEISDIEQSIYGLAGKEFNLNSPSQVSEILFDELKLPTAGLKRTKTGFYSTDVTTLSRLRGAHEIIEVFLKYREYSKLKGTYADTLPKQVDGHNRLHTTFNLTIAQTGRLSSMDPNLQQIPTRTDLGKRIRTAFVAGKGKRLVSADYSQFELRLSAAMSGDEELIDMFNRGADIHTATAAQIYDREPEDVTKQMRSAAKAVSFGILYGMSPHGLSAATGMTYEQAAKFIKQYTEVRKPLMAYLDSLKERARKDGYVETLFGRRRLMPDIHSSNFAVRSAAERAAMNMPIQGTEADLMKIAMVSADKELTSIPGAHQLLQIHDSILVECDEADAERVAEVLRTTMEAVYPELTVKLTVDTTIGQNWGEL